MRKLLLALTLVGAIASGVPADAEPQVPAGCVAVSTTSPKTCSFTANITNGLIITVTTPETFAVTVNGRLCDEGGLAIELKFTCSVANGERVTASVQTGVISVRNTPPI